jgi:hypothetical protein
MIITKTPFFYDVVKLQNDLQRYKSEFTDIGQLSIRYDPNRDDGNVPHLSCLGKNPEHIYLWQYDATSPIFQGSEFEKLLEQITMTPKRVRLMAMKPRSCYSLHQDTYRRLHWAIETWPECHMSFKADGNNYTGFHIPADGFGYLIDTRKPHTAVNPTNNIRYHLVLDVV